ncbi:hypothetical protein MLD38_027906 [Melastoma candidum]|uniref:Uncharacterized protein n=1 Tax=Melastoma candidum TaxID=119954 RepID=A0ACB9N5G9_9MYRT|nr:hypothetical protein MLD38_027906 [Melastoma candidum]
MGSAISRCGNSREPSPFLPSSQLRSTQGYPYPPHPQLYPYAPSYPQPSQEYEYEQKHAPHPASYTGSQPSPSRRKLERKYSKINDDYTCLEQVTEALAHAGLESSNLIVGIDFSKSNEWTGAKSFNQNTLHHIGNDQNPYEQAISIIGKTLSSFDEDNLIPVLDLEMPQPMIKKYSVSTQMRDFAMVLKRS